MIVKTSWRTDWKFTFSKKSLNDPLLYYTFLQIFSLLHIWLLIYSVYVMPGTWLPRSFEIQIYNILLTNRNKQVYPVTIVTHIWVMGQKCFRPPQNCTSVWYETKFVGPPPPTALAVSVAVKPLVEEFLLFLVGLFIIVPRRVIGLKFTLRPNIAVFHHAISSKTFHFHCSSSESQASGKAW